GRLFGRGGGSMPGVRAEPLRVQILLIGIAIAYLALFLVLPLIAVFIEALREGLGTYVDAITARDALSAILLTLTVAAVAVPLNLVFGLAASWAVAKFEFWGKSFLTTLIDLPFSVSPVISGLIFVLLFGANGWFGAWLQTHDIQIIFTAGGIILAT